MNAINFIKKYHKKYIGIIHNSIYDEKNHNYEYYLLKYFYKINYLNNQFVILKNKNYSKDELKLFKEKYFNNNNDILINHNDFIIYINNDFIILDEYLLNNIIHNIKETVFYKIYCKNIILNFNDNINIFNIIIYGLSLFSDNIILKNNNIDYIIFNNNKIILETNINKLTITKDIFIVFNNYKINNLDIKLSNFDNVKQILNYNNYDFNYINSLKINIIDLDLKDFKYIECFNNIIELAKKFNSVNELIIRYYNNNENSLIKNTLLDLKNLHLNILTTLEFLNIINIKNIKKFIILLNLSYSYNITHYYNNNKIFKFFINDEEVNINNNDIFDFNNPDELIINNNNNDIFDFSNPDELIINNNNRFNSLNIIDNNIYLK